MKNLKKIMALVLVAVMMMAMGTTAFASTLTINSTADTDEAAEETTAYKAWKLLDADIAADGVPTTTAETGAQEGGKVAYYTTSSDVVTALGSLFDFVQVSDENKWYATAKESFTSADQVTTLLGTKTEDELTALFGAPAEFNQTEPGGSASTDVSDGYYYINSTLGEKIAVLTVGDTVINTKNSYPTDEKTLADETSDAHAQIGDDVNYTLTVNVPATANQQIVLTDTMTSGLTFKAVNSVKVDSADLANTAYTVSDVVAETNSFTITFPAETVKANQGKTITISYTAILNDKAVVGTAEKNKLDMDYGNNYKAVPSEVETETHSFTFEKVDGSTQLTGAEFQLLDNNTVVQLVVVTEGVEYRVATAEEIADTNVTTTDTIVTKGVLITVKGVDSDDDHTYTLHESKAPAGGYNLLTEDTEVNVNEDNTLDFDVENNKGSVLPSTGGIGTTIFYILGSLLVLGAGIILVTKRRMSVEK